MRRSRGGGVSVSVHSDLEEVAPSWDALADRLGSSPFLRPGWILAWSRAFAGEQVSVLMAKRDGEMVGVLPLIQRRGVASSATNWHTPLAGFLVADQDVAGALAEELLSRPRVRTDLSFLDPADPGLAQCQAAAERHRYPTVVRTMMRSPYVSLTDGDWESYRASLARKVRNDVERRRRRLEEQGALSFEFTDGGEGLEGKLEEGFAIEGSGWKEQRGTAITSSPETLRFYMELARWAASRNWLLLAFLRLDGRPIAFDLCLDAEGVIYKVKIGYDPAYRQFAPGMQLTYETLRRGFALGRSSYELLGDDSPYKLVWTQTVRDRIRLQVFRRTLRGRLSHVAWSYGRPLINRLRGAIGRSGSG